MAEVIEYDILGSKVKVRPSEQEKQTAQMAVDLVSEEIDNLRSSNQNLKDIDIAVLVALKMAARSIDFESEYKDTVLHLKSGIQEAISFIDTVSKE